MRRAPLASATLSTRVQRVIEAGGTCKLPPASPNRTAVKVTVKPSAVQLVALLSRRRVA